MAFNTTIQYNKYINKDNSALDNVSLPKLITELTINPEQYTNLYLQLRHNNIRCNLGLFNCLPKLTHLDLYDNPIGNDGATEIVKLFQTLGLIHLELGYTLLNDRGAVKFAPMLETNTTLQILGLEGNNINSATITILANSLKSNTTLLEINLSQNPISAVGIDSLIQLLEVNTTIQLICLQGIILSLEHFNKISSLFKKNREKYSIEYWHPNNHHLFATYFYFQTRLTLPKRSFAELHCHKIVLTIFLCNCEFTLKVPDYILILILSFIQRNQFL